ncbi:MAG TPA: dihydroorotate dehydrogenase [Syntrophales bacterium]|jgi:dihydroorotate dehydrogenase (NAD+) catalytic subunit|nr:dihydroorotate dehydrogenase [Syntrophales bacterium]HQA82566.1 dihydroorotate dehydrogenase [Syntrophales bacterium]
MPDLSVDIGGLKLKNPIMTASGTFGYGEEYAPFINLNDLGAIIVKGLSLKPRMGNPPPRIIETASGMLNAIGLQNVGVQAFIEKKMPYLRTLEVPVIANILGEDPEEYQRIAERLTPVPGVAALEVNISCPNVSKGGIAFGANPESAIDVVRRVKSVTDLPVIVKLSPNVTDIAMIAEAVESAGADALSLINTITGMSVDIDKRIPHLKNITGGLSGPAIKPIALRMVWQVVNRVKIPVIGVGGIMDASDTLEFLIVGATAVQIGTANFINPQSTIHILNGLLAYMEKRHIRDIHELIGTLKC